MVGLVIILYICNILFYICNTHKILHMHRCITSDHVSSACHWLHNQNDENLICNSISSENIYLVVVIKIYGEVVMVTRRCIVAMAVRRKLMQTWLADRARHGMDQPILSVVVGSHRWLTNLIWKLIRSLISTSQQ